MTDGKKLGRADVDAALKAWPQVERAPEEWEKSARSIEAKIAGGAVSARAPSPGGAGDLLRPPLPPGLEEVQDSAPSKMQTTERERDRRSLQDLAKLASSPSLTPAPPRASAPPPPSAAAAASKSENDSGIVDLKMMAVTDPGAAERAKTTPLASAELFADDPAEAAPSSKSVSKLGAKAASLPTLPMPSASAPVQAVAVAPSASVRPSPTKVGTKVGTETRGPWLAIGGVASIFAIAAVAVFMVKASRHDATAQLPVPSDPVAAEPVAAAPAVPQPQPVAAAVTIPAPSSAADPSNLPIAQTDTGRRGHASSKPAAPKAEPTAAPPPPDPRLIAKDLPPSTAPSGSLNDALRQAAGASGDTSAAPAPAAGGPSYAPGSVPQKPSQGAVTGALGAVMQNARACLEPDGPISRATVTFESGGTVQAIRVTGSAAGKPAEACIKAALTQAKVPPFAQSTYMANVTIRPN